MKIDGKNKRLEYTQDEIKRVVEH